MPRRAKRLISKHVFLRNLSELLGLCVIVVATLRYMTRTWGAAAVLVGAMIALAGCGGSGSDSAGSSAAPSTHATKAAASASSSPVKKTATATVTQYASIIAKNKFNLNKSLTELQGPDCVWSAPGHVDVREGYFTCSVGSLTVGMEAEILSLELETANKPDALAGYIGPPPPEIKTLVKDTKAQADQLGSTSRKAQTCTKAPLGSNCEDKLFKFSADMSFMQEQLAAWDPYLS